MDQGWHAPQPAETHRLDHVVHHNLRVTAGVGISPGLCAEYACLTAIPLLRVIPRYRRRGNQQQRRVPQCRLLHSTATHAAFPVGTVVRIKLCQVGCALQPTRRRYSTGPPNLLRTRHSSIAVLCVAHDLYRLGSWRPCSNISSWPRSNTS